MAITYFAKRRIKKAEGSLEESIQALYQGKVTRPGEVEEKLEDIATKRVQLLQERAQFVKNYPGEPLPPGRSDITLPGYVFGSTTEVELPDGTDPTLLRKTTPGELTGSKPTLGASGQLRPDNFGEKIGKFTQSAFRGNLDDRFKKDPVTGKAEIDPLTKQPIFSKGVVSSLRDGEIIGTDLRRRIHFSVDAICEAQGITTGDPAINEAIEHELVTLVHLKSKELLINDLNLLLTYRGQPDPNENTVLGAFPPTPAQAVHPDPLPAHPTAAQQAAQARQQTIHDRAVATRVQQLQALGFAVPDPANPPTPTLGEIANRLTDPAFDLASPQGRQFMNSLPDEGTRQSLKNLITSARRTQHDVIARKNWADAYHRELETGAKGAPLKKASKEYKNFLKREKTLSNTTIGSSVDALLAAGSAAQGVITAPPGKLDAKIITNRVGDTIQAGAREGEPVAIVTTRADDTKSVVGTTITAVETDAKDNKSANFVLAGLVANKISQNVLDNKGIDAELKDIKEVKGIGDIDTNTIRRFYVPLYENYKKELRSRDTQKINTATTQIATLASLGSTVYAIARKEGVAEAHAQALAKKLMSYDPNTLSAANIGGVVEKEAGELKGANIPSATQKKLAESARLSLATSKGRAASKYGALNQTAQEYQQAIKRFLPDNNLSLRLAQELTDNYEAKAGYNIFDFMTGRTNQEMSFIKNTIGEEKLPDLGKENQLIQNLSFHYFEHGKLDTKAVVDCYKSANIEIKNDEAVALLDKLANEQGKLKVDYLGQREVKGIPPNPIEAQKAHLEGQWAETAAKIPQTRTFLEISTAAEAAGYDPAQAKAAGELVVRMKYVDVTPKTDAQIADALINALPSKDPVVKTAVFSSLEFKDEKDRTVKIKESYAESSGHGRETTVALALANAAKSTVLTSENATVRGYADGVANDLVSHAQGYLARQHQIVYDTCIDHGRPIAGNPNAIPDDLKIAIKQNVRAAHGIAIGKIAGQEAVTTHQATIGANSNLKNIREVAAVSAAIALSEGLSEDLSLEIGKQMSQHYAESKGVLDETKMDALMETAFIKYGHAFADDNAKKATKIAILRPTKAAAGLTPAQRGTAHAGTTVATVAVPVLPQTANDKIRCKAKALAVAHLCASGDDPDNNTVEIGNALAVTDSGLKASEQLAQSSGLVVAVGTIVCETIFTGFAGAHGTYPLYTTGNLSIAGIADANNNPHTEIKANIAIAFNNSIPGIVAANPNANRTAISEATDNAIQTAAAKPGSDAKTIAIAGSISASTTAAALEAKLPVDDAKQLGLAFAELNPALEHRPESLATVMEIAYSVAKIKEISTTADAKLEDTVAENKRGKIQDAINDAKVFVDIKLGEAAPPRINPDLRVPAPVAVNHLQIAITNYTADPSRNLAKLNNLALSIIDGAATKAEKTLPSMPLLSEALFEAKKSEAAAAAALRIAQTPGLPSSTLNIVRERARYYEDRARSFAKDSTIVAPHIAQEVDRATIRNLAETAGVSGFALAKGIIKGKGLVIPPGTPLVDQPKLRAQAATEETSKIMGAKDDDAKAAGLEAKLSIEQKLTPREVGGTVGIKLNQAERPDVANPAAAVAAYFAPNLGVAPKTNQSIAQDVSQSVGATDAHDRRVLADGEGLEEYNRRMKVNQNYLLGHRQSAQKKMKDAVVAAKPDQPAPTPTAMTNDPVSEEVIEIDRLGSATIKRWDPEQKTLVEERLEDLPEFQEVMAELKTCQKDGVSFLTTKVFKDAAQEFNDTFKPKTPINPEKIVKNSQTGKHWIPLKNLSDDQTKEYLKIVAAKAKFNMAHTKTVSPTLSGGGLKK